MDKKKILVVEDEKDIREDLIAILEMCNYKAYGAYNGKVGLQEANNIIPDLIISDIMMPELDGIGLLQELQKNASTSTIPFLFLTAKSDRLDIREGMTIGADDYITKPFDINELLKSVETRLKKSNEKEKIFNKKIEDLRSSIRSAIPHEIRTPLNAIIGFSDILMKTVDHIPMEDTKDMLSNIYNSSKRLYRIFEKYIFYSNLEIAAANNDEIMDLRSKITYSTKSTIGDISSFIMDYNLRLSDLKLNLLDAHLYISEEYLAKIVEELVDNCCKFSLPNTDVLIQSHIDGSYLSINFIDSGRGMTSEQIHNTAPYIQFDRHKYEQQGNGLGLAIVKRIVEIHDGEFNITSEVDKSTCVEVKLPLVKEQS